MDAKVKNKITERFIAIYPTRSVEKLREIFFFRVISAFAKAMADKSRFSRAMFLCLFAWIFVVVSVFAESYPNRPTASELEGIVILGKECVLGVNERCYATQTSTNPVSYGVEPFTNTSCWYLDQNLMGTMASKIKLLVPCYVDPDTVYEDMPNISMFTVAGVWAQLEIGDKTANFTQTPEWVDSNSVTHAAAYGDCPWRIYATNMQERSKAIWAMDKTKSTGYFPWQKVWQGHGCGTTAAGALSAAATDYKFIQEGQLGRDVRESCKVSFWSNYWYYGGGGGGDPKPPGEDPGGDGNYKVDDLIISAVATGVNITVSSSDISTTYPTYQTNVTVTGTVIPNITGEYLHSFPSPDPHIWVKTISSPPAISTVEEGEPDHFISVDTPPWAYWTRSGSFEGAYLPSGSTATGTAYVAYHIVGGSTNLPVGPDYSGTYYAKPNNVWQGGAGYIFITNGSYIINSNLTLDANGAYLTSDTLLGDYDAVNFNATTLVSASGVVGLPCEGIYIGESPTWALNSWTCGSNGGSRYISSTPPSEWEWTKSGSDPEGTYEASGAGTYGDVSATIQPRFVGGDGGNPPDTPYKNPTPAGTNPIETITLFYECWITKVICTNDTYTATNIEHKAEYWIKPTRPTLATTNSFNDEGLLLTEDVLNSAGEEGGWSSTSNAPVVWAGSGINTPPEASETPALPNTSTCSGFQFSSSTAVVDWLFQYCKDKFW